MAKNLSDAKRNKNDEFYTLYQDIEKECQNYKSQFKDKIIYCNCDNPVSSNFFKYFMVNFKAFGLKKLICTCYDGGESYKKESLWDNLNNETSLYKKDRHAYKVIIPDIFNTDGDNLINLEDMYLMIKNDIQNKEFKYVSYLEGDGDFRSKECIDLLDASDIVITNPPFSLFRDYINLLEKNKKKYLIVGNMNAITYKEVFPLIKENKLWLGYKTLGSEMYFNVPEEYKPYLLSNRLEGSSYVNISNNILGRISSACWFTNLDVRKRHEKLYLYKQYNEDKYKKYNNLNIINVDKIDEIPNDYFDIIGVPITFLEKYCPEQFEILGIANSTRWIGDVPCYTIIDDNKIYNRILIRRKPND